MEQEQYGIEFRNIHKSYDGKTDVINGLNLTIPSGQRTVLLGPSGCGKSTLLRMIAGLEEVTEGELLMGGQVANDLEPGERNVAMVFQNYALYPHMTVEKNIKFGMEIAKFSKEEQEERLNWALDILGLSKYKTRYPRELSGGQRQRVALCRALVKKAPYFLLDEPLSNLDAQLRTTARAELVKIHEVYEPTFIYVTHDQIEAMTVGQKIIVLNKSIVQQYDTPDAVYNSPANVFVAKFIGSPSMNVLEVPVVEGQLVFGESKVTIPDKWRKVIGDRQTVTFGIRPEHIRFSETGDVAVNVTYIENHGNEKVISYSAGEHVFMATTEPDFEYSEAMKMVINWDKVHLFDGKTTENLGYPQ